MMPTRDEAIHAAAEAYAASLLALADMTPEEQASAEWTPTRTDTVDDLARAIRAERAARSKRPA